MKWLLLLHQIPPKPPYFRAKILRRLNSLGAVAIKNSAYVLPWGEETLEDLQWIRREIQEEGGGGWLFASEAVAGLSDEGLQKDFREARRPEWAALAEQAQRLLEGSVGETEWRRLKRRLEEARRITYFGAPGQEEVEDLMNTIERRLQPPALDTGRPAPGELKGRTWVTRRGIKVDRIGSAWLIGKFIDPEATFQFVDPKTYRHEPGQLRFDMFEGEFTHQGDRCTFEVLLDHAGSMDPALRAVAEIVHDIDLKDGKFQRGEAAGIAPLIEGIALRHADDSWRLEEGTMLFESLYARLRQEI